jgi:hypothetical protein
MTKHVAVFRSGVIGGSRHTVRLDENSHFLSSTCNWGCTCSALERAAVRLQFIFAPNNHNKQTFHSTCKSSGCIKPARLSSSHLRCMLAFARPHQARGVAGTPRGRTAKRHYTLEIQTNIMQ